MGRGATEEEEMDMGSGVSGHGHFLITSLCKPGQDSALSGHRGTCTVASFPVGSPPLDLRTITWESTL